MSKRTKTRAESRLWGYFIFYYLKKKKKTMELTLILNMHYFHPIAQIWLLSHQLNIKPTKKRKKNSLTLGISWAKIETKNSII